MVYIYYEKEHKQLLNILISTLTFSAFFDISMIADFYDIIYIIDAGIFIYLILYLIGILNN